MVSAAEFAIVRMSTAQHKYDLLAVAPREGEFAGFAESLQTGDGRRQPDPGSLPGSLRVIVITMLAIEFCDRLD